MGATLIAKDNAVAGIVVAVMIVGLVLAVVSIIQTIYVPKWMESREAEHMGVVGDQFSQLKYAIDTESTIQQPLPISTSITLGSKELGFLTSSKAYGRLTIEENATSLDVHNGSNGITNFINQFGILKYTSENTYYLNQAYIYELGALILNQTQGMVLTIKPSLTALFNTTSQIITLNLSCVTLKPVGGKTSISGYGTYPIRTGFLFQTSTTIQKVASLRITTHYPQVWYQFFNDSMTANGISFHVNYGITQVGNQVTVTFDTVYNHIYSSSINNVILNLKIITVQVQIAPGWVG